MAAAIESQFGVTPELVKSAGGKFEVSLNDDLVFSKIAEDRFPDEQEVIAKLTQLSQTS